MVGRGLSARLASTARPSLTPCYLCMIGMIGMISMCALGKLHGAPVADVPHLRLQRPQDSGRREASQSSLSQAPPYPRASTACATRSRYPSVSQDPTRPAAASFFAMYARLNKLDAQCS
ncbi:hypothetical protein P280DRAFT_110742 [Massarina eburnea CBS 473.64]|uniref:Uncharacterized protein n=1 Tax=Massarina eburnea CBS 473.64 TaxID=1395130 RepID=A0A6A6RP81_9PLEO|nr:hypothetical protein P280DRAFT_110742 [Massarina eburnea CBS 473.64]